MSLQLGKGGPLGAVYRCSKNGWSNENLFFEWIQHFANYVKASTEDPLLLLLDNHSSHISLDIYKYCKEKGIVMVTIPPHTSHKLQPLDLTFFSPLKTAFNRECDLHMKTHVNEKKTPYDLAELFNRAFLKVATMEKAVSGFRSVGVCPLNPDKFQPTDFEPAEHFREIDLPEEEENGQDTQRTRNPGQNEVLVRQFEQIPGPSSIQTNVLFKNSETEHETTSNQHVKVSYISPIPKPKITTKKQVSKRKGQSTILTATSEKSKLELEIKLKQEKTVKKELIAENRKKRKLEKVNKRDEKKV